MTAIKMQYPDFLLGIQVTYCPEKWTHRTNQSLHTQKNLDLQGRQHHCHWKQVFKKAKVDSNINVNNTVENSSTCRITEATNFMASDNASYDKSSSCATPKKTNVIPPNDIVSNSPILKVKDSTPQKPENRNFQTTWFTSFPWLLYDKESRQRKCRT